MKLVTIDPRRIELADYGVLHLSPRPGSNAAVMLGIAHVIEVVKQLRGVADAQVPGCEVGVYGGYTGHMASTLVLTKDR